MPDQRAMSRSENQSRCHAPPAARSAVSLPVVAPSSTIKRSRMSRRRAAVLIAVHVLILAHVAHWLFAGKTLSPLEPSEAMYTLNEGHLNAGFIFLLLVLGATLISGRFLCGWGCHLVAYQDLCAWLLKKIGIKVKPLRSRILVLAPLALAVYMFVWPSVYRWYVDAPKPALSNHLMKSDFWETFPGPGIAILTILVCGFVVIYFLGAKGFCTYACPYGGLFRVADRFATGRIRVTDACEHCGHCTAVCTSNVRVHEEVARYGMVVDPGCMKCMDCVSVCPNNALYFGFGVPSISAVLASPRQKKRYDLSLAGELCLVLVGLAALLSLRGLYDRIPLLLAMALAAVVALLAMKSVRLARDANVRLQNLQLKRGGRWTRTGVAFAIAAALLFLFAAHGAVIQYNVWRARTAFAGLDIDDEVWSPDSQWWQMASTDVRARVTKAAAHYERADQWGLLTTPSVLPDLVWLYLAADRDHDAQRTVRRLIVHRPEQADPWRGLANVMRKARRFAEAEGAYRKALAINPKLTAARDELGTMLMSRRRFDDAADVFRDAIGVSPDDARWKLSLAAALLAANRSDEAIGTLQTLAAERPGLPEAHYNLGYALLAQRRAGQAIPHLTRAVELAPDRARYHYNLGVAAFMAGHPAQALGHVRHALRLDPTDPDAQGFFEVLRRELPP